jgi:hypothetical protein
MASFYTSLGVGSIRSVKYHAIHARNTRYSAPGDSLRSATPTIKTPCFVKWQGVFLAYFSCDGSRVSMIVTNC